MKYYGRKALALVLSAILIASTASTAFAQDPVEKDEVVYINLSHDGSVESIYVVNAYDLTEEQPVTDFGNYREVKNLTTTEELSVQDGAISFTAPKGKFYYQGELDSAQIPWLVSVTYQLDGQPISGGELAGKEGHLEMTLSLRQNPDANPVYFDNFAIQATVLLDSERCKNITAPSATLANVGGDKQMSYIVLPGKEKDFTISADVTDFEMDAIQINGIPLTLDIDDPDTTEIKDKIYELKDGAKELDDGAFQLDDGATQLQDGALELKDGAADLYDGTDDLYDGVKDLDEGADKLRSGAGDLKEGADQLKAGFDQLNQSSRELKAGIAATQQQMISALEGSGVPIQLPPTPSDPLDTTYLLQVGMALDKGFDLAIGQIEAAIKQLESGGSSIELAALAPEMTVRVLSAAVSVDEDGSISEEGSEDTSSEGSEGNSGDSSTGEGSEGNSGDSSTGEGSEGNSGDSSTGEGSEGNSGDSSTGEGSEGNSGDSSTGEGSEGNSGDSSTGEGSEGNSGDSSTGEGSEGNSGGNSTGEGSSSGEGQLLPPADEGGNANRPSAPANPSPSFPQHQNELADPGDQLAILQTQLASLKQFKQVNTLCMGTLQYMAGTEQLSTGYTSLYDGILELRSGISELVGGVQELLDGSKELFDGASDLRDGVDELFDGTTELKDGTIELTDGTTELRDQSDEMDSKVDEEIDKMLDEYRGGDFDMVSFVSDKNTQVDSVQFVMKVAEIQIEEEEAPVIQEEVKPSFWQKLVNLFK